MHVPGKVLAGVIKCKLRQYGLLSITLVEVGAYDADGVRDHSQLRISAAAAALMAGSAVRLRLQAGRLRAAIQRRRLSSSQWAMCC